MTCTDNLFFHYIIHVFIRPKIDLKFGDMTKNIVRQRVKLLHYRHLCGKMEYLHEYYPQKTWIKTDRHIRKILQI